MDFSVTFERVAKKYLFYTRIVCIPTTIIKIRGALKIKLGAQGVVVVMLYGVKCCICGNGVHTFNMKYSPRV